MEKKVKKSKSYKAMGYTPVQRLIANLDKCSKNGHSQVVKSPWGTFKMYKSSKRGRFYSVSGSKILHNGGSYKIASIRSRLTQGV